MDDVFARHGLVKPALRPEIPGGGPQTLAALLDAVLAEDPEREALVGRHGRLSYAELDREANRAAATLASLGVGAGDRVAACLPNDVEIVIAFLGTQRLGAVWVGVNRVLAGPEKVYLLADSGARVFLASREAAAEIEALRAELPALEQVLEVEPEAPERGWIALRAAAPGDARPTLAIDPFLPAAIAYTSGTTGFPKGAVHSQHNLLLPGAVAHLEGRHAPGLRQGVLLPLTILNLVVLEPLTAFQDGRCCVCMDRLDPEGIAEWVRTERIGRFSGVPTIFRDLLTHPNVKPADLESLTEPGVGGATVPPEILALYRERFGREVAIGYGMTEAPTAVAWTDGRVPPRPGLCGRAVSQLEIQIVGEEGALLAPGEVGEICLVPATTGRFAGVYTPMLGYWNNPEATAEALRDGRYHSGDLGVLEENGDLYIRGRRSELILRGGANVYPAEVERVLEEHPAVAAAAVFGVSDERLGERVVAAVQLEGGAAASEKMLRSHARERLARYKVPEAIRLVAEMPRNAMGKIVKRALLADWPTSPASDS